MSNYASPSGGYGGGGGFMSPGSNTQGTPGGGRSGSTQSLRPVTIAQLRKSSQTHSDSEWIVDGHPIGQVTLVGEVTDHKVFVTNHTFALDDGTGTIEAKLWLDSQQEEAQSKEPWRGIPVGNNDPVYVRATGTLKSHNNKKYIHLANIFVIRDHHELYFHILEVITVGLYLDNGYPGSKMESGGGHGSTSDGQGNYDGRSAYAISSRPPQAQKLFSSLADRVSDYMTNQPPNREGFHIGEIAQALDVDAAEFSACVERMIDDGLMFTTIDESHIQLAN